MAAYRRVYVICRLTAKNRDQLRNPIRSVIEYGLPLRPALSTARFCRAGQLATDSWWLLTIRQVDGKWHRSENACARRTDKQREDTRSPARNVCRILVRGSMPPCRLRRRKFWKFDYEMVHSEVNLNKRVVSIAPFSTPACPDCSQNININTENCSLFCMFSLLVFHPFFQGVSRPHLPLCADAHVSGLADWTTNA